MGLIAALIEFLIELPFLYFTSDERDYRKIKRKKTQPLSKIKEGDYVKLVGNIVPISEQFTSPLTNRKCVFYQVEVDRSLSDGESTIVDEVDYSPFALKMGEDVVVVQTHGVKWVVAFDKIFRTGLLGKATGELKEILAKYNIKEKSFGFRKSLSFKEGVLRENDKIAVLGVAQWTLDENGNNVLHIRSSNRKKVIISNKPKTLRK